MMKISEKQNDFHSNWDLRKKRESRISWLWLSSSDKAPQGMHNTCRFMYTTMQMHNALEFKYPAIEIHNTHKFKYPAIQTRSTYQFKSVENIYYQVPVYKNRGGCCYSHYLHRWWVGCGKPTKGNSPTRGNIVVLTRVPIPTVVGPRGKSTPCVRLGCVGTGGAFHMQICLMSISEVVWSRNGEVNSSGTSCH